MVKNESPLAITLLIPGYNSKAPIHHKITLGASTGTSFPVLDSDVEAGMAEVVGEDSNAVGGVPTVGVEVCAGAEIVAERTPNIWLASAASVAWTDTVVSVVT